MSDSPDGSRGSDDWADAQRQFWEAWAALGRRAGSTPDDGPNASPWNAAAGHWWKSASREVPPEARPFFDRLMEQGNAYFKLGENFRGILDTAAGTGKKAKGWKKEIEARIDALKHAFEQGTPEAAGMLAFWQQPLSAWQELFPELAGAGWPGGGTGEVNKAARQAAEQILGFPGLGLGREWQGDTQEAARLWVRYQAARDAYESSFRRLGPEALDRMRKRLVRMVKDGERLETLRGLYDLWVDCGEEAYAELVATDEYADLYADLVNSLLACRCHSQAMSERLSNLLNLPSRRELDAVHRHLHDTRRELSELRARLGPAEDEPSPAPPPTGAASRRTAPRRKKATARPSTARRKKGA